LVNLSFIISRESTFEIILGVFLVFFGSKFIRLSFSVIIFCVFVALSFLFFSLLNLESGLATGNYDAFMGIMIISMIVGCFSAIYISRFAKTYLLPFFTIFSTSEMITFIIAPIDLNPMIRMILIVLGGIMALCF